MADEILVKGNDGKWYILKGEELLPYEAAAPRAPNVPKAPVDLPKGVTKETHDKMEASKAPNVPKAPKDLILVKSLPGAFGAFAALGTSHESHPLFKELTELVDTVVKEAGSSMEEVLQKRFRTIVSARLREVRDRTETNAMLIRGQKIGGLEMQNTEAERIGAIIEKAFQEFQAKWKELEAKRREERKVKQQEQRGQLQQQEQVKEQDELEDRYRRLVAKDAAVPRQQPAQKTQSVCPVTATGGIPPSKVQIGGGTSEPLLGAQPRSPSAPARSVSAALLPQTADAGHPRTVSPSTPIPKREEKKDGEQKGTSPRPYTIAPRPSQKITDIKPVPKLVGPLEELGRMTMADFRRLGANPKENAAKISAKIDRLRDESLIRKSQGIAAWRASPLQQLYGQIMNEVMERRISPATLLAEKQPPPMTSEEFDAIMELNQKLRF